jgi:uncharacterized protein YcfJ
MKTIGKFTKTVDRHRHHRRAGRPRLAAFAGEKTDRAVVGALIGGIAGAALGHGKGDAVAIGAVAGAALGASTANNNDRRYSQSYRTAPRYSDNRYGYDNRYSSNNYATTVTITATTVTTTATPTAIAARSRLSR